MKHESAVVKINVILLKEFSVNANICKWRATHGAEIFDVSQ